MAIDPCIQTSVTILDTCLANEPVSPFTCSTLDDSYETVYYSDFGTLLFSTGYTTNGSGISVNIITNDVWINNNGDNGPLLRCGVWAQGSTDYPFETWIGFSECFTETETKTYYIGLAGDNSALLRVNGQIIVKQTLVPEPLVTNFRYWNVYPVTLHPGHNVLEFLGFNVDMIGSFGFEVYDNTYNELLTAYTVNDLNIVYSTSGKTAQIFDLVYDDTLTPLSEGYVCQSGSSYVYESCSGRCLSLTSVTINNCLVTSEILDSVISNSWSTKPSSINKISYGRRIVNDKITNQRSIIYNYPSSEYNPEPVVYSEVPSIVSYNGFDFITDITFFDQQILIDNGQTVDFPFTSVPCPEPSSGNSVTYYRPLVGGLRLALYYKYENISLGGLLAANAGTLGFMAVDNEDECLVGVTNGHVVADNLFATSQRNPNQILQNADLDAANTFLIGSVKRYDLSDTTSFDNVDGALISLNNEDINENVSFGQINITGWTLPYDFASTEELDNLHITNPPVYVCGATTGHKGEEDWTRLVLYEFKTTMNSVRDNQGISTPISYDNILTYVQSGSTLQPGTVCQKVAWFGDSGSAIIADFNGTRKIIGLLFFGSFDATSGYPIVAGGNRIDAVARKLNIRPYLGGTVGYSQTNYTEDICLPGASSDPYIDIAGKRYFQLGYCSGNTGTVKFVDSCTNSSYKMIPFDFKDFSVEDGKSYIIDYLSGTLPNLGIGCYTVISASTDMPINIVTSVIDGPFDTCLDCINS